MYCLPAERLWGASAFPCICWAFLWWGSAKLPWGEHCIGRAQGALVDPESASSIQIRSTSPSGPAVLRQHQWSNPHAHRSQAAISCGDRASARRFIQRARTDILRQLKIAFYELVATEAIYLKGGAYYATLGAVRPESADDARPMTWFRNRRSGELVSGKLCPLLASSYHGQAKCANIATGRSCLLVLSQEWDVDICMTRCACVQNQLYLSSYIHPE